LAALRDLGIDAATLGARPIARLRLVSASDAVEAALPRAAAGLSRRILDAALLAAAEEEGALVRRGIAIRAADLARRSVRIDGGDEAAGEALLIATGKHELRGSARPRDTSADPIGLRTALAPSPALDAALDGVIELHLFDGGYAGIVLQEDGSANVCLAVRKSLIGGSGANPMALLARLAAAHPHFALRLEPGWRETRVDTIGSVPYGWSAQATEPGLFRLGDQAAVIPSLAGEGIDIAIASGIAAAEAWIEGGAEAAPAYQQALHERARGPLMWASAAWGLAERPAFTGLGLGVARLAPGLVARLVDATRLD